MNLNKLSQEFQEFNHCIYSLFAKYSDIINEKYDMLAYAI